ncbi:MAG: DUF4038 domain-containing protein [Clostridia bacterium]|nr:DUF4038 domain-containing protein [Clostridia bacterium]
MKKILSILLISILCVSMVFSFTACSDNNNGGGNSTPTADNDGTGTPGNSTTVTHDPAYSDAIKCEIWRVAEISLTSSKKYIATKGQQGRVVFDGVFKHKETGEVITRPGFWDGGENFKIRFAPTKTGIWEYETKCETDENLNGAKGVISVSSYTGNLELYKRGFVTTDPSKKYFVYADGTPFFYLGDTHWTLLSEEFDSAGDRAGNLKTNSHFKYIVDKRIEQGFTVYQSEPLNSKFDLTDGLIQRDDLVGLQDADRYFQYIADKGLVHANAQFFFPSYGYIIGHDYEALDYLARYWVARFGAYPVMWTLAQEIDNDFYYGRGDQTWFNYQNNPWLKVAESMNKYDDYDHPLTGHQEGADRTSATGAASKTPDRTNGGKSIFLDADVTERTGHSWWGSQWGIQFTDPKNHFIFGKDYWQTTKPAVIYEGRYCGLWTKDYGARAQGWVAYLNGCYGYGYGAIDIWSYKSTYSMGHDTDDGRETVTVKDKQQTWADAVEFASAYQVGYMRQFLQKLEWWKLVPDFDAGKAFASNVDYFYSCAYDGNKTYVIYLFNQDTNSGKLANMDNSATYTVKWFNPRTNEYTAIGTNIKPTNSTYTLPAKPDANDWVILATKN